MDKKEILFYGALLESNMYVDRYGSTDKDTELLQLQKALKKVYGVTDGMTEKEQLKIEEQIHNDLKDLVVEYRTKINEFLMS